MSEQKHKLTVFLMNFASWSVRDGSGPNKNFIAMRSSSGAHYPRANAGRAPKKLKMKNTEGRGTAEMPCQKWVKEGKEVYSEGEQQVTLMLFFVVRIRSESEVITILPTVRSIAAFFIS